MGGVKILTLSGGCGKRENSRAGKTAGIASADLALERGHDE
jgi:hypothetical protein